MRRLSRIPSNAALAWLAWMNAMPSGRSRRASRRATAGIRASACLPGRSTTVVGTPASSRRPARGPGARISARGAKRSSSARITRSITISDPPSSPNGATNSAGILAVVVNSPRPRASWAPAAWARRHGGFRMRSRRRATSSGNAPLLEQREHSGIHHRAEQRRGNQRKAREQHRAGHRRPGHDRAEERAHQPHPPGEAADPPGAQAGQGHRRDGRRKCGTGGPQRWDEREVEGEIEGPPRPRRCGQSPVAGRGPPGWWQRAG